MRWQKRVIRAVNVTQGTLLGERIRIAETGLTRIVGLLGERTLPEGDGLLIMPSQGVHTWGMLFPIDVIVLDNDWRTIAIRHHMKAFRMTRLYWGAAAVLELPAGCARASSTQVGDLLDFKQVKS